MAKKKKKDKKKKDDEVSSYTLDSALKSSKKTETALQGLLKAFSEDMGHIPPKEEEKKIEPQLSYETKKKIAEGYMMEDVPLSERQKVEETTQIKSSSEIKKVSKEKKKEISIEPEKVKNSSISIKDNIYVKLSKFFEDTYQDYNERYKVWENSISAILSILRKMRKITKKNTEDLVNSINKLHEKIQFNLQQFKIKRDEVEKLTNVDIETMSSQFKKVLGLLELQIKEYQLKRLTDEFIHQQKQSLD